MSERVAWRGVAVRPGQSPRHKSITAGQLSGGAGLVTNSSHPAAPSRSCLSRRHPRPGCLPCPDCSQLPTQSDTQATEPSVFSILPLTEPSTAPALTRRLTTPVHPESDYERPLRPDRARYTTSARGLRAAPDLGPRPSSSTPAAPLTDDGGQHKLAAAAISAQRRLVRHFPARSAAVISCADGPGSADGILTAEWYV